MIKKVNENYRVNKSLQRNDGVKCWNHYAYTKATSWRDGRVKLGDTEREDVLVRVEEQVGHTSDDSQPYLLYALNNVPARDNRIHSYLRKEMSKQVYFVCDHEGGTGKEWVCFRKKPSSIEELRGWVSDLYDDVVHAIENGRMPRANSFAMRPEQENFVERASDWFAANSGRPFLLAAKMRFGKTFACYKLCQRMSKKKILILSYKTASKTSWRDDLEDHVDFEGWRFYDYKECEEGKPTFDSDRGNVFFVSMQALMTAPDKWSWVRDEEWDMVLFDEEHYGKDAAGGRDVMKRFSHVDQVHMSGTAFRSMSVGSFDESNTFTWTYCDEQEAKRVEEPTGGTLYKFQPRLNFIGLDVKEDDRLARIKEVYVDDENPCFRKILRATEDGRPAHGALDVILEKLEGVLDGSDLIKEKHEKDHVLAIVPGVQEAKLLKSQLELHSYFKRYHVINAAGSDSDVVDDIDEAKRLIDHHERTITISCGRFGEAVTVPEWTTVVLMSDIRSPEKFFQMIFRTQSARKLPNGGYKRDCYVVDFALERMLSSIYEIVFFEKPKGETLESYGQMWLRNAPIHRYGNEMVPVAVNFKDLFEAATAARARAGENWVRDHSVNEHHELTDEELAMLSNVSLDGFSKARSKSIVKDGKLKNGKGSTRGKSAKSEEEKDASDTLARLHAALEKAIVVESNIPRYLLATHDARKAPVRCVDDLLTDSGCASEESFFAKEIGVKRDELRSMVDSGLFNKRKLDDKLAYSATVLYDEFEKLYTEMN